MRPLWHDEIFTIWASRLSPRALVDALSRDSGPALLYLLEKPLVRLAEAGGWSDRLARLLPLLAALLAAFAVRSLPSPRSRSCFLVLCAASPFLLLYSAEARAYALLAALDLALYLLATRGEPSPRRLAAVSAATVLVLWLHYLGIFFVAALAAALAARRRWRPLAALGVGTLGFVPWLPILAGQPQAATAWMREDPFGSAVGFLSALGGAGRVPGPFGRPLPDGLFAVGVASGLLGVGALLFSSSRKDEAGDAARVTVLVLVSVVAVSVLRPIAFAGRTEMAVLPVWLWALASAADRSRLARAAVLAASAVGAVSVALLLAGSPRRPSDASPLLETARKTARPRDVLVATSGFYMRARLAFDRGEMPGALWSFPPGLDRHPGWFLSLPPSGEEMGAFQERLAAARAGTRFLFLLHPVYVGTVVDRLLVRRGPVTTIQRTTGGVLLSWTAARGAPASAAVSPSPDSGFRANARSDIP